MAASLTATANVLPILTFDPSTNILYAENPPTGPDAAVLRGLAEEADRTANSLAVASVLAGQSSEGDDYTDVAFWLGKGDYSRIDNVLKVFGLQDAQPTTIPLSSQSHLPATLAISNAQAAIISEHLDKFSHAYCFSLPLPPARTLYVFIGQLNDGWGGLVGIGIHSDD